MAFRMRYWLGLVAVGITLVAVWRLPPSSMATRDVEVKAAEEIRQARLSDDFRWTDEALRRVRWSDSLSALAVASADRGVAITMPSSERVREEQRLRLADKVSAEIEALGARDSDMTFAYVFQPFQHGSEVGRSVSSRDRTETYVGKRDGVDYCMQVRVLHADYLTEIVAAELTDTDRTPSETGSLGPCRFYLAYGLAGSRIQTWLEEGGIGFSVESGEARIETVRFVGGPRYFGSGLVTIGSREIQVDECLAGETTACASVFLDPRAANPIAARELEIVRRSPATSIGGSSLFRSALRDDAFLLSDLEAEFGHTAFARFWTSDADVDVAFRAAFGVDAGTWMRSWVDSVMGIVKPGPGLPRSASSGSMMVVGLLVGIAYLRTRRRIVT